MSAVEDRTLDLDLLGFWLDLYVQVELRFFLPQYWPYKNGGMCRRRQKRNRIGPTKVLC